VAAAPAGILVLLAGAFHAPSAASSIARIRVRVTDAWSVGHRTVGFTIPVKKSGQPSDYVRITPTTLAALKMTGLFAEASDHRLLCVELSRP
jgi:endonuclease/exonuclease/phosphatase (EEP) superfamily protein YafD